MFVDEARIFVKAGDGGRGCKSFERMRGKKYGRPNGGIGGNGGDVLFIADNNKQTLIKFRYNKHFKAVSGGHGSSNNKRGEEGDSCTIEVPPGTMIRDEDTGMILRDLKTAGERVIIAKGGAGGSGNSAKKDAAPGEKGESKNLILELKLVADVGIIGYPNAGKSTFLSKITKAKPRVASFPFTTKSPMLGVAQFRDFSFVVADIPGLIEGAHAGRGLGDRFLRHIERTKLLLHLVDMAGIDGREPDTDFPNLNMELELYSGLLRKKPQIVAANKMDMPAAKKFIRKFKPAGVLRVHKISALTGEGIEGLLKDIACRLKRMNS
ncbi:MAG: Obg family GTPase CgtA [Candidatus Omnitrophota bacterium]|nr:Obg family GTPase CgtA [Candidatus Omnitrophota bacterium]